MHAHMYDGDTSIGQKVVFYCNGDPLPGLVLIGAVADEEESRFQTTAEEIVAFLVAYKLGVGKEVSFTTTKFVVVSGPYDDMDEVELLVLDSRLNVAEGNLLEIQIPISCLDEFVSDIMEKRSNRSSETGTAVTTIGIRPLSACSPSF